MHDNQAAVGQRCKKSLHVGEESRQCQEIRGTTNASAFDVSRGGASGLEQPARVDSRALPVVEGLYAQRSHPLASSSCGNARVLSEDTKRWNSTRPWLHVLCIGAILRLFCQYSLVRSV